MTAEPKHWPEEIVREAVSTTRRAQETGASSLPTLLSAAVILADHTEWTHANLARRITMYFEGVAKGFDLQKSEAIANVTVLAAAQIERLENELRAAQQELAALKAK